MLKNKNALIMVDIQNDFCPGGNLAVPDGHAIVKIANTLQPLFDIVIATKDWHPQGHMSFASNHPGHAPGDVITVQGVAQVLWPDHCVQGTPGAEFHPELNTNHIVKTFFKGTDRVVDSYSAFFDNQHLRSTQLGDYLQAQGIENIYILGLATDYCVKYSCVDAAKLGFKTHVIIDVCRGIDLVAGDIDRAVQEMLDAGVEVVTLETVLGHGVVNA
jgi:nicotinamidase/pyrazinamidase